MGNNFGKNVDASTRFVVSDPVPHEDGNRDTTSQPIITGDYHAMRLRRLEEVSEFLEQVWNNPTERFDAVIPMPFQKFCMVSVHCQIWAVIHSSRGCLHPEIVDTPAIRGFVPVSNTLINGVIKFMEEKTGIVSNYSLPESNPKFVTRLETPKKLI
jgi:hypothetical protein